MTEWLRSAKSRAYRLWGGLQASAAYVSGRLNRGIYFVAEGADWVIDREGEQIIRQARLVFPDIPCVLTTQYARLYHQVIHFGSLWTFVGGGYQAHESNRIVVTVFHGGDDDSNPQMKQGLATFRQHIERIDVVVTANSMMRGRLLAWGVPEHKLQVIPLGVDLSTFRPPSPAQRQAQRERLSIPEDLFCIGSFQKDGSGWGEGLEPKPIKGPDIFLAVVRELAERYPIFVLLTGPARGYVKRGLETAGIPYRHDYLEEYDQLPAHYHCLDLYLVTSREEGGPKALPECMATGVPLVSTKVGMVPDIIEHEVNGFLVDTEDVEGLVSSALELIKNPALRERFAEASWQTVQMYDWPQVASIYCERVYRPLLSHLDRWRYLG